MIIDLTDMIASGKENIYVDQKVDIPDDYLNGTSIRKLDNVVFQGEIIRIGDDDFQIHGNVIGEMILPDDVTLEDVIYPFQIDILEDFGDIESDNYLKIDHGELDILDFLWQNILVEVPSKISNGSDITEIEGDGWRFISEDKFNSEKNLPFSELSKVFDSRKE